MFKSVLEWLAPMRERYQSLPWLIRVLVHCPLAYLVYTCVTMDGYSSTGAAEALPPVVAILVITVGLIMWLTPPLIIYYSPQISQSRFMGGIELCDPDHKNVLAAFMCIPGAAGIYVFYLAHWRKQFVWMLITIVGMPFSWPNFALEVILMPRRTDDD